MPKPGPPLGAKQSRKVVEEYLKEDNDIHRPTAESALETIIQKCGGMEAFAAVYAEVMNDPKASSVAKQRIGGNVLQLLVQSQDRRPPPVDLNLCTEEELEEFAQQKMKAILEHIDAKSA